MSKHTPGSWKAVWRRGHRIVAERELGDELYTDLIARVSGPISNANLIAAAPELLRQFKDAVRYVEMLKFETEDDKSEVLKQFRETIAKASGAA